MLSESQVTERAEMVAAATGGRVWSGLNETRVYVRVGKKEGFARVLTDGSISYERGSVGMSALYSPLVAAGLVSAANISEWTGPAATADE